MVKNSAMAILLLMTFTSCEIENPFKEEQTEKEPVTFEVIVRDTAAGKYFHRRQTFTITAKVSWAIRPEKGPGRVEIYFETKNARVTFYAYHFFNSWQHPPYYERGKSYTIKVYIEYIKETGGKYKITSKVVEKE